VRRVPLQTDVRVERAPERKRMMHRDLWLAGLCLSSALACSSERDAGAQPGAAGSDSMSAAGTASGGSTGADCVASGTGRIQIQVRGLPDAVPANLLVGGPLGSESISANRTLDTAAGPYVLTSGPVAAPDPIVRTLYADTLDEREFCLRDGETHAVALEYDHVATSHALWTNGSSGDADLVAFAAGSLTASARVEPSISALGGAGKDVTFDAAGNLWSMGATLAESHLLRFPRAVFVSSGAKQPDRQIDIEGIECIPALRAFAFDAEGSLWVSTCGGRVVALSATELATSGSVSAELSIEGLSDNGDLAFDIQRNLWVTDAGAIVRYDAERLVAPIEGAPDARLELASELDGRSIVPSNLAFDVAGNLWVIDFGGNLVAELASSELEGSGERSVVAATTVTLGVLALLERPAFDESGGLWIALDQNRFGRLSETQLTIGSDAGAPTLPETIVSSPAMGYAHRMALFPAPGGLPLYHRFP
jgi:hypothetical protein